jgi:uncharacterized protein YjeT (DUF2065 family)
MPEDELARRRRLRSGQELRERLAAERTRKPDALDLDPLSAYELLTRQMVGDMAEELREIRLRVNGLLFVTVGIVVTDVVLRVLKV